MNLRDLISSSQQTTYAPYTSGNDLLLSAIDNAHYVPPVQYYSSGEEEEQGKDEDDDTQIVDATARTRFRPYEGRKLIKGSKRLKLYSGIPEVPLCT